jgi:hypothetical protein
MKYLLAVLTVVPWWAWLVAWLVVIVIILILKARSPRWDGEDEDGPTNPV